MSAPHGESSIIVIERFIKGRQFDEKFPPQGAIDFYHII